MSAPAGPVDFEQLARERAGAQCQPCAEVAGGDVVPAAVALIRHPEHMRDPACAGLVVPVCAECLEAWSTAGVVCELPAAVRS